MRMVPINNKMPKAFLEVGGQTLIERLIMQLNEAGVTDISVVVGFMKEHFEFLTDKYNINLIQNDDFATKNNLHSLLLAKDKISSTYIVPCDVWCRKNPFKAKETHSWYMVSDMVDNDSDVRVNQNLELYKISNKNGGNAMLGICYLQGRDTIRLKDNLAAMSNDPLCDSAFWEEALYDKDNKMFVKAKVISCTDYFEVNTYEQLRSLDDSSKNLKSNVIAIIAQTLKVNPKDISNITVLKKGMTNRSFLFSCKAKRYIMRIPGEGTDLLINRKQEAEVYRAISALGICDDIVYINEQNGYKITEFLPSARVCDADNVKDLRLCMKKLREFHNLKIKVSHTFDVFSQIEYYESLWEGEKSVYKDYAATKENVFSLRDFVKENADKFALTHIDAVPDNFLFTTDKSGKTDIRLIDWEYAGMQDPHVDIAMFCIYSLYNKKQVDRLINIYFADSCNEKTRTKIYCYIAMCGLLWSNWCEYKRILGVEFGEYSLRQYKYAKDYYKIAMKRISKESQGKKQ